MNELEHNQERNQTGLEQRRSLRRIIVVLDNMIEYNRVRELADLVRYHSKLMSYYGLDLKTGKWNTKRFPATQTDAQIEGINSDIDTYNKAVRDCNKYGEFLAKKYCVDIDEQVYKGSVIIFRPPSPISAYA
jgi:hypothetical protein